MKVAFLGATKGMGRALARSLAARGDSLCLLGRHLDDVERSAADLRRFVLSRLRSLQRLPWTVRMFFLTPDTQYAAG